MVLADLFFCSWIDSYGVLSGDSYAARISRPRLRFRWQQIQRTVINSRNEEPPAERAIITGVVKNSESERVCRSRRRRSRGI